MRPSHSNLSGPGRVIPLAGWTAIVLAVVVTGLTIVPDARADDEALIVTPPGFTRPGEPKTATGADVARIRITVRDGATGRPTPCRLNVVGPDGNFYQPAANPLSPYSLTGQWPKTGKGNREGKAPFRYLGRFFYTTGEIDVAVPAGNVRVEVWKGFEYRPEVKTIAAAAGQTIAVDIVLDRSRSMTPLGYDSGDPHLHFDRKTEADDRVILDLLEAEDIRFGSILAYNEPPGPYKGVMDAMASPQLRGLGRASVRNRGATWIASGQEYRSSTYGHLNLFWRDDLVLAGQTVNADDWPLYGALGRETRKQGGFAIYAHGGYAQAIYADFVRKDVDAVELLQFGVYRGIELADWYHILNIGYRFPCVGASDYPACRKLGDCLTYVQLARRSRLRRLAQRRGRRAGASSPPGRCSCSTSTASGRAGSSARTGRVRIACGSACAGLEVAPIQAVQIIVNGRVVHEHAVPAGKATRGLD